MQQVELDVIQTKAYEKSCIYTPKTLTAWILGKEVRFKRQYNSVCKGKIDGRYATYAQRQPRSKAEPLKHDELTRATSYGSIPQRSATQRGIIDLCEQHQSAIQTAAAEQRQQ
jgi:hypothetical protein